MATPVISPVETAVVDGSGGILLLLPDARGYPEHWPDPSGAGGQVLWRVTSDGTAEVLYDSGVTEWPWGVSPPATRIWKVMVGR